MLAMPPTIHTRASDASRTSARVISQPSRPDTIDASPMPTSTKRMPVSPSRHARPHMRAATTRAPANAASDTAGPSRPSRSIEPTAARLAPPVTPRMSGLASGLRSVVWNSAPPSPSAVPAMIAASTRGRRSRTITNSAFGDPWPTSAASTSPTPSPAAPRSSDAVAAASANSDPTATTLAVRRWRRERAAATRTASACTGSPGPAGTTTGAALTATSPWCGARARSAPARRRSRRRSPPRARPEPPPRDRSRRPRAARSPRARRPAA